ncbi:MAG: hypothetical protein P9M11_11565 [Candidatus Tenebribacter burtonii]|jgi:hypothetical protein|nr:hypothetical protein [Candidatus Tenebribacter burtonii]
MNKTELNRTELTKRQLDSIPVILSSKSIADGLKEAKIGKTTYYAWLKLTEYKEELNRIKKEIVHQALNDLKISTTEAVKVLTNLLNSDNENIQLRTATKILDFTEKFIEQEEIIERIEKIEEKQNNDIVDFKFEVVNNEKKE